MPPKLAAYLRQPSTITGLALTLGLIATVIAYAITRNPELVAVVGIFVTALVHLAMPDNSAEAAALQKLAKDAVVAAVEKRIAVSMPTLQADVSAAFGALQAAPGGAAAPVPAAPAAHAAPGPALAGATAPATPPAAAPAPAPAPAA